MQISTANENGVLAEGYSETLASNGRSHAAVTIALCEDRLFRYGLQMMYSHGGFGVPITVDDDAFTSLASPRMAAIQALLHLWPQPFPSDPSSVHHELQCLREQVEGPLRQPSLF